MFQFNQIQVSDNDIKKVESHFGFSFSDEQKAIIRNWESCDIQACPGSGKTTTLAAKLIILAEKLPKSFKQGICVITHTNTAVDEIKHKLGDYAKFYSKYPHHLGTIQSFVDKYLAIPAYKMYFKTSPKIIDNNHWLSILEKKSSYQRLINNNYIQRMRINISSLVYNSENFSVSKKIIESSPFIGENTNTYRQVKNLKDEIFKNGFIRYDEAYSIAFSYLRQFSDLQNIFPKRFPLVFIDEMQDMETHQFKLISDLFDDSTSIIQKIGDINQSIFGSSGNQEISDWKPDVIVNLQLTKTNRLCGHLADIVKPICVSPQEMEGTWNPFPLIKPTIIVFNDNNISSVKDKFVEIIKAKGLQNQANQIFKAIGSRKYDSLSVKSYWNDFNKENSNNKRDEFDTLISYLDKCLSLERQKNVKEYRKILLNGICYGLKLVGVKNPETEYYFTPFTLTKYLSKENEIVFKQLNLKLSKWILNIQNKEEVKVEITNYFEDLLAVFGVGINDSLTVFLSSTDSDLKNTLEHQQDYQKDDIIINFDTIHGVKGETHTATLYLETYNRTFDIGSKILPFIALGTVDDACRKRLPLAYVAMSRPTHLLCLAVHEKRFTNNIKSYFDNSDDWEVEYLSVFP